jgi:hypothetical protein
VKDLSTHPMRMSILSERSELRILHPGWLYGTIHHSDSVGKDLSSHPPSAVRPEWVGACAARLKARVFRQKAADAKDAQDPPLQGRGGEEGKIF